MRRALLLFVFASLAAAGTGTGAAAQTGDVTGTPAPNAAPPPWSTTCTGSSRTGAADCTVEQRVFLRENGRLLGGILIRVPSDTRSPVMRVHLPLGLYLPAGVTVAVDDANPQTLPIQTCEASGCYAGSPVSADLIAAMKRGTSLSITFQNLQQKPITMPISLAGFTAAFGAVE